jgi:hypothetical protein
MQVGPATRVCKCSEVAEKCCGRAGDLPSGRTTIEANHPLIHQMTRGIEGMAAVIGNVHGTKAAQERTAENVPIIQDEALAMHDARN